MSNFNHIIPRNKTNAFKVDYCDRIFGREGLIPMWVADMDFASPRAVTEALIRRAQHPIYGYTARPRTHFEALQRWMRARHNWNIQTEWCLHSPTVLTSLALALDTLAPPGAPVVIQTPVYAPFYTTITRNHRNIVENPLVLKTDGSYDMDFSHLESLFASGTRHFIFCSPHNPVGRVWTKSELETLRDLVIKYNVTVFSDEIHCDIVFPGHKHTPFVTLDEELQNHVVTCVSPTKTFNMAGLAVSAIIVPNKTMRQKIEGAFLRYSVDLTNTFAVEAFEAAFTHGEAWLNELLLYLQSNIEVIEKSLAPHSEKVRLRRPEGTYLAWLDFRGTQWNSQKLAQKLVQDAGLALEPGTKFGESGSGFARLNFACPQSTLTEALTRLEKILA
jgi:cystathionine beta-lyase